MANTPHLPFDDNQIRGQAFRSVFDVIDEVAGPGSKERVMPLLPCEIADAHRYGAMVASGWFPIGWYQNLHLAIRQALPVGSDIHRRIGFASTRRDINGVYRFLLQIASPEIGFTYASRILGTYFKDYRSSILENVANRVRIKLEIPGACSEIWSDIAGGSEAILSACGARSGAVVVRAGANGTAAELEASWAGEKSQPRAS